MSHLIDAAQAAARITSGEVLILAGEAKLLAALPQGNWIGGTIPYFMTEQGGLATRDKLFATRLPDAVTDVRILSLGIDELDGLYSAMPENGFGVIILPGFSDIHSLFALRAPDLPTFATRPLIGWIAGMHLEDMGSAVPAVFDGTCGAMHPDRVVVLYANLPSDLYAELGIVNIFEPDPAGAVIRFAADGFAVTDAEIGGEDGNLAKYILDHGLDTRLPLVADYCGTMVNTSFRGVDGASGRVEFYAPVFAGISYRLAKPTTDYAGDFVARLPAQEGALAFSCNCILNYLYGELEGRTTGSFVGPFTFGEVGYQLLNQTMVHLDIKSLNG